MASQTVVVDRADDDERFLATDLLVWFDEPESAPTATQLEGVPPDQRFAARVEDGAHDPATYPGIYGVRPMQLSVPYAGGGRWVPMAGLTWVGVHPDHRRRGVLTEMLRHHVEQTHREGVAVSGLHASEAAIYGRHGWGLASQSTTLSLGRGTTFTAPGLDETAAATTTRLATETGDDLVRRTIECEQRVGEHQPGSVVGDEGYYRAVLRESPERLRDKEPRRMLFAVRDGVDVGLAAFRRTHKWEQHRPQGTLEVHALFGDPATRLALLRRLVDFDLMATVKLPETALDDPLWSWLGPRAASDVLPADNLWVRLVDLPAALPLRSYAADCDVVVDLVDPYAPWHAGRWRVVVDAGEGRAERTDAAADVELPVWALGAAYLGGGNLLAHQRAGLLPDAPAVGELWRAFRTDLPPATAIGF
ncbi:GNAT family N-acetyltransferase [Nocardioides aestuarii]|uniref:GNAT family N-acetyltransferase n=1 Tax=Nocardioides aestuarii TaxID=252231 RepID=A0ABW4TIE1_9ACTN